MRIIESKRCRTLRRVLIGMFIVCAYLLSCPFVSAYITINDADKLIYMTALNLAFGSMGADHPVYMNAVYGMTYIIVPVVGFFFMCFDRKSNLKNLVGIACGVIGCLSIALPIGMSSYMNLEYGAFASMLIYLFITPISAASIFVRMEDNRKTLEN